jgi:flagellar motility protein MotE (MotC chaperone)
MMNLKRTILSAAVVAFLCHSVQAAETDTEKEYSSVEERRIETSILQERENIRKEREDIALREKELKTLEESVDKKLAEMDNKLEQLKQQQKKIEALLAEKTTDEKKRIKNLAGIYEKMTPAKAALSMSGLEQQLAADLLANMKVKAAAKILDEISKQKATELSTAFSTLQIE